MKDNECVIGLDCGGTHTEGYLYDSKGNPLHRASSDSGNVVVNYSAAIKNISSVVSELINFSKTNNFEIKFIMLGIAGLSFINDRTQLINDIGVDGYNHKLVNDAELGLFSELGDDNGCIVIAGTGSTILSKNNDQVYRVGGWGHILGDEGGAYFIGKQAFKSVVNSYDEGIDNTFNSDLLAYLNVKNIFELIDYFYKANKTEIAAVAKFVFDQADKQHNSTAENIVDNAANELSEQIKKSLIKANLTDDQLIKIIFSGTPLEKNENYRCLIISKLNMKNVNVSLKKFDNNAFAAYKYYTSTEKDNG